MPARRIGLSLALATALVGAGSVTGCGGEDDRPPMAGEHDGSGGDASDTGGGSAVGGDGTGMAGGGTGPTGAGGAGEAGAPGAAGAAGAPGPVCGNDIVENGEDCDGSEFAAGIDCPRFGFDDGEIGCHDDCTADTTSCSGTESCYDGHDNDGDGLVDCGDGEDCSDACSDPCGDVPVLADPGSVYGTTSGSVDETDASCGSDGGPELIYELTATTTGQLDVELSTSQNLSVSARTTCDDAGTELACSFERLNVAVTQGDTLYLVVEGFGSGDAGSFTLEAASRAGQVCGDGFLDPGEGCEDENTESGDGCDSNCQLESTETEPNDTVAAAETVSAGDSSYAEISPLGDVDVFEIAVAAAPSTLRVNTYNVGIGMCGLGMMDSFIDILDQNGTTVLTSDDDSGDGYCARAVVFALQEGTYYVRVSASPLAPDDLSTFPYRLGVSLDVCGNGTVAAGEECDDGNLDSGDGCSGFCRVE